METRYIIERCWWSFSHVTAGADIIWSLVSIHWELENLDIINKMTCANYNLCLCGYLTSGLMVVLDGQEHFSAWHIFMIVCAVPTPLAVIGLLALPESPRILLQIGHEREALVIYQVGVSFYNYICNIYTLVQ